MVLRQRCRGASPGDDGGPEEDPYVPVRDGGAGTGTRDPSVLSRADVQGWISDRRSDASSDGLPPTRYRFSIPRPPLAEFVARFWYYEGVAPPHAMERVLPDGAMQIVINLRDDALRVYDPQNPARFQRFPGCLACGARSSFVVLDTASQTATMGVHFKPGGAFPFLAESAGALRDADTSLDALWGAAANDLRAQLCAAATPEDKFRLLEQTLLARVRPLLVGHPAVAFALRQFRVMPDMPTVAAVVAQAGLSPRHFVQVFSDAVGLTPKLFCRIRRFQNVLRALEGGQRVAWADVAVACGYCDQAHLIRDFQAFAGLTPTAYLARRGVHGNHVPLPD